jgi:hypothetical protein
MASPSSRQADEPSFAILDRQPAQVLAVKLEQIEGAEYGSAVVTFYI